MPRYATHAIDFNRTGNAALCGWFPVSMNEIKMTTRNRALVTCCNCKARMPQDSRQH